MTMTPRVGQRVIVTEVRNGDDFKIANIPGTVARVQIQGDGMFVDLDYRAQPEAHPFPETDRTGRARTVLTYPDWCRPDAVK